MPNMDFVELFDGLMDMWEVFLNFSVKREQGFLVNPSVPMQLPEYDEEDNAYNDNDPEA